MVSLHGLDIRTSVQVSRRTRNQLYLMKKTGESYEDVIIRLIALSEEKTEVK